ncbi:MAG: tetratricopeptide repeat protein [Acidobacteria bacterium]|nr:tetratricopeptide repeat protein [Acidobacteriota bacterium]
MLTESSRSAKWVAVLLLILATTITYFPVKDSEFIDLDDDVYVTDNPWIQQGLNLQSISWAMTSLREGVWNPMTWISFMLDYQLFGLNPAGYHLTNLVLHLGSVLLLLGVLYRMTERFWPSLLVAALFALHPLNVESVAWVTERKNVLSTLFWMLSLWAYLEYLRKPVWQHYVGIMGFLILGLMSKQMLVTLPCALLLLDYWPLRRLGDNGKEFRVRLPHLVLEKVPLFAAVLGAGLLTLIAAHTDDALPSLERLSLGVRLANAPLSYALYLKKMVWPMDLAVFYPHPGSTLSPLAVALAILVLAGISLGVWWGRKSRYLVVGWLWYLGTLVPAAGLIQVGGQSMADRHTYIPAIGIFIMLIWGVAESAQAMRLRTAWLATASLGLIISMMLLTRQQLGHWKDSITLFEHTVAVTEGNYLVHNNLGTALLERGNVDAAIENFSRVLEIRPHSDRGLYNMALALRAQGEIEESAHYLARALQSNPSMAEAYNNLGIILIAQKRLEDAITLFKEALEIAPRMEQAHNNLGTALISQGRVDEALVHFLKAVEFNPYKAKSYNNLGAVMDLQGRSEEALSYYQRALELSPTSVLTYNNMGKTYMDLGNLDQAATHFSEAIALQPDLADAHFHLGLVRTDQGNIQGAITHFQQVLRLNPAHGEAQQQLMALTEK